MQIVRHLIVGFMLALTACALSEEESAPTEGVDEQAVAGAPFSVTPQWAVMWTVPGDTQFCSASILDERWLLTAGHCLEDIPTTDEFTVLVFRANGPGTRTQIARARARRFPNPGHPGSSDPLADVGLIYLEDVGMDLAGIGRSKLYTDAREPWNDSGGPHDMEIAGWGFNNDDCDIPPNTGGEQLRLGTLVVDYNPDNDRFASAAIGATHACGGDSGAPYLLRRGISSIDYLQFAVHSGRRPTTLPGGWTSLRHQGPFYSDNRAWIESTLTAWTSQVFTPQWIDALQGGDYAYRQSQLATHGFGTLKGFLYRCAQEVSGAVQMRTCGAFNSQEWLFLLSGELVVPTTQRGGRCLTLTSFANRTQLTVTSCRALTDPLKSQQLFWYDTGGHIHPNGAPLKCVEVGGSTEGAPVQVFDCNETSPQMWLPGA